MPGRFDSVEQLYNDLMIGHEYAFAYKDNIYSVDSPCVAIGEKRTYYVGMPDSTVIEFNAYNELLDGFIVEGKSFREFMFDVDVKIEF